MQKLDAAAGACLPSLGSKRSVVLRHLSPSTPPTAKMQSCRVATARAQRLDSIAGHATHWSAMTSYLQKISHST